MSNVPPGDRPPAGGWQPPSGGYQPPDYQAQQASPTGQMAPWWKRLLAILIDGLLIGIPLVIVFFVFVGVSLTKTLEYDPDTGRTTAEGGFFTGSSILFQVVALLVTVAYYGLLNGSERGQTVGKMALGIRVRDADGGGPIGVGRGALRALVASLPGQIPFVGVLWVLLDGLWPLWDPRSQALHDKVANSVVVDAQ